MPGVPETDGLASGATGITAKLREKMLLHWNPFEVLP
jgi:hypothetical protein